VYISLKLIYFPYRIAPISCWNYKYRNTG